MGDSFKNLLVWQRSMDLALASYQLTAAFPNAENSGRTAQMRRCSVSVPSNIAEGHGRSTTGEYLQFLGHARGSNSELETQLILARQLGFGARDKIEECEQLCSETGRLLGLLIKSIQIKIQAKQQPRIPRPLVL
jgi:four helix bundle protein